MMTMRSGGPAVGRGFAGMRCAPSETFSRTKIRPLRLSTRQQVDPFGDHDLGMLAIPNLATEDTGAASQRYRLAGTPKPGARVMRSVAGHDRGAMVDR